MCKPCNANNERRTYSIPPQSHYDVHILFTLQPLYLREEYTGLMGIELITTLLSQYRYAVMVPTVFIFGAPVSLVAGVLIRLDVLLLFPTCLALASGELLADVFWYWLGARHGESFIKRFGRYVGITETAVTSTKQLFEKYHDIIIFTSKITAGFGLGTAVMFTAGLSRVPFRRYMMLNIAGQSIWTAALLSVGYFLGHIYLEVSDVFEKMALFGLVVVVFISFVGFLRYLFPRTKVSKK